MPAGDGPFPGLLHAPHYGGVNHLPHLDDRQRYVTLIVMHRGQRLAGLLFYRLMEARERCDDYPVEEINDYVRTYPERRQAVARTLAYFDPVHRVAGITATPLLSVGSGRLDRRDGSSR